MRIKLLMGVGLAVIYAHVIIAADNPSPCSSSQSADMPYVGIPEICGSEERSRIFIMANSSQHHIPAHRSVSPIKQSTIARRGKSVSPTRGKLHSSKATLRQSFNLSRSPINKVNPDEIVMRITNESDVYKLLTFEHTPHVPAWRGRATSYTETLYLAVIDATSEMTFQQYLKERHEQEMPGIIARCQFVHEGVGYHYDYALARWWQGYLEQCCISGLTPHDPEDSKRIFAAAEYYLVGEDMKPVLLGVVPALKIKLDPILRKILSFEMHATNSKDASSSDRKLLAHQWFTIGTYLAAHNKYIEALAWLNKAYIELQQNAECRPGPVECKYGHVLYEIAHTYWQWHKDNDWRSAKHNSEYFLILGWLLKAEPRLKKELQSLDAAYNLFGRVYEKIGEVANQYGPDKQIISMNDNSHKSARELIATAFGRYDEVLRCLDTNEPSTSTDVGPDASHMRSATDALINILCLYERQEGLCDACVAGKMSSYAYYLLHWPHKEMVKDYQHENSRRYADAHRRARAIAMKNAQGKIKKLSS